MKTRYNWKLIGIISAVALVLLVVIVIAINNNTDDVTAEAKVDTLTRTIDVTGKIVPADEVTLGFSSPGRISSLSVQEGQRVSRGQVLATLDSSEVDASLRQAVAERNVSESELTSIVGSGSLDGKLESAKKDAYNSAQKALNVSITQIKTNTDSLFIDPQSGRPKLKFSSKDYFEQQSIIQQRVDVGKILDNWSSDLSSKSQTNISRSDLERSLKNLGEISSFFTVLSKSLSEAETNNNVSSATLSEYRGIVTSARSAIDTMINELSTAQENLRSVDAEIPVQEARIIAASASIDKFQAQINNYAIVAPFDGVVVDVSASAGENVSANQAVLVLINNSSVEVEVFVPEIYMKDLQVGDPGRVKIEALGDDFVIGASVVYVEDRGVVRNGIVTYKTTLALTVDSPDIKTGMTAGIEIDTLVVENVLLIPRSATKITDEVVDDVNQIKAMVKVMDENGKIVEKEIIIGRTDSKGFVEVLSGLSVGEKVVVSSVE
ncbi:MAG: HlyD family efflux transporter periplasmic adaptor subunit [Candidatus Paceibacterota bacterium]